jgi:isoquinoline 1-oxidoreductase beta subunit
MEGLNVAYLEAILNYAFSDAPTQGHIPVIWWCSVNSSTNTYTYKSFTDELPEAARMHPVAFKCAPAQ